MTSMIMNAAVILVSFFLAFVQAAPLRSRDIWDPPVTSPSAATIWNVGETQTITWDTSTKPSLVTSYVGQAVLGYLQDGDPGEHLMLDPPLASGFNLTDGKVQITVPNVPPRSTYIVVLMGDSGNASPQFTINGGSASSSSPSSSTPSSSTPSSPNPITSSTSATVDGTTTVPSTTTQTSGGTITVFADSVTPSDTSSTTKTSGSTVPSPSTSTSGAWKGSESRFTLLAVSLGVALFALT
ncbi:hypothetical protein JAAARDRAFT_189894 [Jaapia argillacea MUCL 33604]|uniref:Yeast cell wall synthesis Kre9/Knh1-like N-terminal domain-containing protein n=1 Tax=Jaapia argillacea MUCL 33604 TaxID=933084 RepID=A0A067QIZ8_9AGAM|nr:hypothetical protein JAAARDRAFT_189894 [Jaapia argillacea MUCL 33604]